MAEVLNIDPGWEKVLVAPTEVQWLVLNCPVFEILFGGSKGCAKSELLVMLISKYAGIADAYFRQTGWRSKAQAVLFRGDFTRIGDIENRCLTLFPQFDSGAKYNSTDHMWRFSSGFRATFVSLEKPRAEESWQGQEITILLGDQVEEVPWKQVQYLKMQVRTTDPAFIGREKCVFAANPLGQYVQWVKERYPVFEPYKVVQEKYDFDDGDSVILDRTFIPAKPKDNPHLSKNYWANLMSLPEDERRAYLDGDWNVTLGTYFGECFKERTHVQQVQVPRYGDFFMSGDWGSVNPAAWYCHWRDEDNNIVTFAEIYGPGVTGRVWGEKIIEKLRSLRIELTIQGYLDDNAWQKHGSEGLTPGEKMVQMGLNWFPARKPPGSRKAGLMEMRERFMVMGGASGNRPSWIITPECPHLISQLKSAVKDDKDPDDIANAGDFHALDGARYGITAYPLTEVQKAGRPSEFEEWQETARQQEALRALGLRKNSDSFPGYG